MAEDVVEDPRGRYQRRELIGTGAFKSVYKAYDSDEGIEVAWNQVRLIKVQPQQKAKILGEITILEQVKHEHIMEIYDSWETPDGHFVVFITEIMTMTLKDFVRKAKKVRFKNVKKWALQILHGLDYLHSHDPPIIHRDLKCDNIFMNTSRGEVKIGDLGLSICMKDKKFAVSVIGTPEFMAPELYEELYDEKVDIYAFGMCFLEMVTGDYPYSECVTAAQVYRKVTQGIKPEGIKRIANETVKDFIYLCLSHKDVRPSASELMSHQLLVDDTLDDLIFNLGSDSDTQERISEFMNPSAYQQIPKPMTNVINNDHGSSMMMQDMDHHHHHHHHHHNMEHGGEDQGGETPIDMEQDVQNEFGGVNSGGGGSGGGGVSGGNGTLYHHHHHDDDDGGSTPLSARRITSHENVDTDPFSDDTSESVTRVVLVENSLVDDNVLLKLYLKLGHGYKEVKFPFHLSVDTPQAVAKEMVIALNLSDLHYTMIANGIADTLAQANLVSTHHGRITTITQAIEENNSQIIFTQTTVDPHAENVESLTEPLQFGGGGGGDGGNGGIDSDIGKAVDMMLLDTSPTMQHEIEHELPTSISHCNSSLHLELKDNQQSIPTTTLNTTTTVTVVPNPNPTNPNSILESLVDQMRHDVSCSGKTSDRLSGSTIQRINSPQKTTPTQTTPNETSDESRVETQTNNTNVANNNKKDAEDQSVKDTLKIDIPSKDVAPNVDLATLMSEATECWNKISKQQKEERLALEEKHRRQREEFQKKYPTFVIPASPSHFEAPTPSSPPDRSNHITVIPTKKFSNLTNKVISDIEASISKDLSTNVPNTGVDTQNLITTTTIVNNLNREKSETGQNVYKILTTSMQTTSSASSGVQNLTLAQLRKQNGLPNSAQTPTTSGTYINPSQNRTLASNKSAGQLDVNINLLLQNAPASDKRPKFESKIATCGDDLSSLITKNLTSLSLKTSNPVVQTHQHQHQLPIGAVGQQMNPGSSASSSSSSVGKPSSQVMGPAASSVNAAADITKVISPTTTNLKSSSVAPKFGTDQTNDATGS